MLPKNERTRTLASGRKIGKEPGLGDTYPLLQSTIMNETEDGASAAQAWLARLLATDGARLETLSDCGAATVPALAALAAESLARERSLLLVTPDDTGLPDISNALDLNLRPLCLVLPAAGHVSAIALRATLSLLKSRLSRAGEDTAGPAWLAQVKRLAQHDALWRQCLAWSTRGLDKEPWPQELAELFPVRILPLTLARSVAAASDWVVLVGAHRLPADVRQPWPGAQRTLLLAEAAATGGVTTADPTARQHAELEVLTQELSELELELATAQAEIAEFTRRYHALITGRMATLDELRAQLADRHAEANSANAEASIDAAAAHARAEHTRRESDRFERVAHDQPKPFSPSGDLKKLFRKLAQKIHPDRAQSEPDRAWRTQLMTEANRAYQAGDEAGLLEVMALWQEGASRRADRDDDTGQSLADQLAKLRQRIAEIEAELNRLFGSRLYELFTATNIARRAKRDLLQEMANRLDTDIAAARAQLA